MYLLALLLFVASPASAGGPIYRCGPGEYADHCGPRPQGGQVSRYTLDAFADRTRGVFVCPSHMRRLLLSGEWVCDIPQARTVEPEKDARLLEAAR